MAVDCRLEDERGAEVERVEDPTSALAGLIPAYGDERFQCWRFIDLYGDTVFNRGQMPQFLKELAIIRAHASGAEAIRVLDRVEKLALGCRDQGHLYLKFYGD